MGLVLLSRKGERSCDDRAGRFRRVTERLGLAPILNWQWGVMERTAGFEPAFSTPITVHRFVAGVGYVRVLARRRGFQPRSPSLRGKCPGALDDRRVNWLPDQDSNLD